MADMELEMCNSANIAEEIVDAVATEASNDKEEEEVVNKMNNTKMINMLTKRAKLFYSLWMGAWKGVQSRGWTDGHMEMVDDKEQEMMNNVALFRTFYVG